MATTNNWEAEIDAIRDELYEETKLMTAAEHTRWSNERAQRLAEQFGFTVVQSASGATNNADGIMKTKELRVPYWRRSQ